MTNNNDGQTDPVAVYEEISEHPDTDKQAVAVWLDRFVKAIGSVVMWANLLLVLAIVAQVVLRYAFNQSYPKLDEIQWHFYGLVTMVGISYAMVTDSHVRVDIFHAHYSPARKNRLEIFGLVWLFLPFIILSWDFTLSYAISSVAIDEGSDSPNGLHNLWILKVFMNVAFVFIAVAIWAAYVRFLSRMTRPALWKQLLWAFPSTVFALNLVAYYAIWWVLKLTSGPDVSDRDIGRSAIFGELELGAQEIKYTVIIGFALAIAVILIARVLDRGAKAEG